MFGGAAAYSNFIPQDELCRPEEYFLQGAQTTEAKKRQIAAFSPEPPQGFPG